MEIIIVKEEKGRIGETKKNGRIIEKERVIIET
jgi:hypothetical protein